MAGRSEIAGSRRLESDRRSSRREESRRSQLSPEMSRQPVPENSNREVMASRHYLSRVPPDQSRTLGNPKIGIKDRSPSVEDSVTAAAGAQVP